MSQRESKSRGDSCDSTELDGPKESPAEGLETRFHRRGHRPATPFFRAINSRKRIFPIPLRENWIIKIFSLPIYIRTIFFSSILRNSRNFVPEIKILITRFTQRVKELEEEKVRVRDIERNERKNGNFSARKLNICLVSRNGQWNFLNVTYSQKEKEKKKRNCQNRQNEAIDIHSDRTELNSARSVVIVYRIGHE